MYKHDALLASKGIKAVVGQYCQWIEFHEADKNQTGTKI